MSLNENKYISKIAGIANKRILISALVGVFYSFSMHLISDYTERYLHYISFPDFMYKAVFHELFLLVSGSRGGIYEVLIFQLLIFVLLYWSFMMLRQLPKWVALIFIVVYLLLWIPFIHTNTIFI